MTPKRPRRGFTLVELLVVIAIIAVLAAIIFPVFARAREKARQASCASNMKQIVQAFTMYADDWDGTYPGGTVGYPGTPWPGGIWGVWLYRPPGTPVVEPDKGVIYPYIKNTRVFLCPSGGAFWGQSGNDVFGCAYEMNGYLQLRSPQLAEDASGTALLLEAPCDDGASNDLQILIPGWPFDAEFATHNEGANFGYVDGHVKWTKSNAVKRSIYSPQDD